MNDRGGRREQAPIVLADTQLPAALEVSGYLELQTVSAAQTIFNLHVTNQSDENVLCSIFGAAKNARSTPLYPAAVWVPPRTTFSTPITVPHRYVRPFRALVVHAYSHGQNFIIEADVPQRRTHALVLGALAALVVLVMLSLWTLLHPRVISVAFPSTVYAGSVLQGSYATAGMGERFLRISTADGRLLGTAHLQERAGPIRYVVLPRAHAVALLITLSVGSSASANAIVQVMPTPAPVFRRH